MRQFAARDLAEFVAIRLTLARYLALALLIGLQWVVAWLAVRVAAWRKLIKSEPRLLAWRGELNEAALREERMSPEEVYTAVRASGSASLAEVEAVVIETDGSQRGRIEFREQQTIRPAECAWFPARRLMSPRIR